METRSRFTASKVLRTWRTLMKAIPHMNEAELTRALDWEVENGQRKDCIARIHRRLSKLKRQREAKELLQ